MNEINKDGNEWKKRVNQTTLVLGYWTAAWLASTALATFGPLLIWDHNVLGTLLVIILNTAIGFGMILAYKRHLNEQDEMMQKIQLEAMAMSLGIGLVCGLSYSQLDISNVISSDAEISYLVILMGLTYLAGIFMGLRKYR